MPLLLVLAVVILLLLRGGGRASLGGRETAQTTDANGDTGASRSPSVAQDAIENFDQAIATLEGFGKGNNRPTRDNNPGDLRSAPGMIGIDKPGNDQVAIFGDVGDGWDALTNYVRSHAGKHPDWDFYDFFHYYLTGDTLGKPLAGQNDLDIYAENVANYVGVDPTDTVSGFLGIGG